MPDISTDLAEFTATAEYPYEIKTVERGEKHYKNNDGWHNHFIVKMNKQTGDTWILTHIIENGNNHLKWVFVTTSE